MTQGHGNGPTGPASSTSRGGARPSGRRRLRAAGGVALVVGLAATLPRSLPAQAPAGAPDLLKQANKALAGSAPGDQPADLKARADHAVWSVFTGELAADPESATLFTGAVDQLEGGLSELDGVLGELASDPAEEQRLTREQPALAMRLDAARIRRERAAGALELARESERERLSQLRELVRAYRDVANALAVSNAHFLVGNADESRADYERASQRLGELEQVVAKRRDFYLFDDEPALGEKDELPLVTSAPEPFSKDMKAHLTALQALAAYRLAVADAGAADASALEAAVKLAESAAGTDPKNPIALYVLAAAHRQLGLSATAADPISAEGHRQAGPHFQDARTAMRDFRDAVASSPAPEALRGAAAEVAGWARELDEREGPGEFLARADRLTSEGLLPEAHTELGRGLSQHRAGPLLLARLETGRRGELDLPGAREEFRRGGEEGLLDASDPQAALVGAKLALAEIWRRVTASLEGLDPSARAGLLADLDAQRQALARAETALEGGDAALRAQVRAHAALAVALRAMVDPSPDAPGQQAALRQAEDSAKALGTLLEQAEGAVAIALREAVVAARLAQGYLVVRILPDYRDAAANAFAAAADEQARLPFRSSALKAFGSPLITALLSRPEGQAIRRAYAEGRLRRVATRLLDASIAQAFGDPGSAADEMATALDSARSTTQTALSDSAPLDAGGLLEQGDAAQANDAMIESLRSFSVLSFLRAGRTGRAMVEAVTAALGDDAPDVDEATADAVLTPQVVDRAIRAADEPLEAYALAASVEARASAQADPGEAARWFALASQAHRRAKALFDDDPATRRRYPRQAASNERSLARLASPRPDLDEARRLRQENQAGRALALLREAIKRHPAAPEVRAELALAIRDQVDLGQADPSQLREALAGLPPSRAGLPPEVELVRAELHERLGEPERALASYRSVLASTDRPEDRVRATSRLAVLAARVGRD